MTYRDDHATKCWHCGLWFGGVNRLGCACDDLADKAAMDNLATALAWAGCCERAFCLGFELGNPSFPNATWEPGCGRISP